MFRANRSVASKQGIEKERNKNKMVLASCQGRSNHLFNPEPPTYIRSEVSVVSENAFEGDFYLNARSENAGS